MTQTEKVIEKLNLALSDMQKEASDAILNEDKDVVILSPTGTGKTLAYLLPLCSLIDKDDDSLQAIVICPGRELALQSANVLKSLGTGIRGMAVYGGRPTMDEHRVLRKTNPQILFATPGRLKDHIDKENIQLDHVECLVIDEFDKCLEMGFRDEMHGIMDHLSGNVRHILLSATDAEEIPDFVNLNWVKRVDYLGDDEGQKERVGLYVVKSDQKDKADTLLRLMSTFGDDSSIVFVNYRDSVERLTEMLQSHGFSCISYHGGLDQKQREDHLYRFENKSVCVLVSTDLGSRGLDIKDVNNIVHYHLPETEENYVHRVGRTARWDSSGSTWFILGPEEQLPSYVDETPEEVALPEEMLQSGMPKMVTIYIGKGKKDKISKGDILGFLCKVCGLGSKDVGRIDVYDRFAYAAVAVAKADKVLKHSHDAKVKGVRTVVEKVK